MDALPLLRCRTEFRTYIAVLQSKAVPSSEQACFCLPSYLYYFLRINYSSDFERLRIRRHRPTKYLLHSSHLYDDYGAYLAIDHHSHRVVVIVVTSFPLNTDRPSNISDLGFCTCFDGRKVQVPDFVSCLIKKVIQTERGAHITPQCSAKTSTINVNGAHESTFDCPANIVPERRREQPVTDT